MTQGEKTDAAAEAVVELAQRTGELCGYQKGVAAAMVLDRAYGMVVADMIGPGADEDRVTAALLSLYDKLQTWVRVFLASRTNRRR